MISNLLSYFRRAPAEPLKLSNFKQERIVTDDTYNGHQIGSVKIRYYDNDLHVATLSYQKCNGQIGLLFVHCKEYSNRGLGKQMLRQAIYELTNDNEINPNVDEIWAVSSRKNFWSNVFNKSFKARTPAHPSVTGSGFFMKIIDLPKE
jgi:hypothetical protein